MIDTKNNLQKYCPALTLVCVSVLIYKLHPQSLLRELRTSQPWRRQEGRKAIKISRGVSSIWVNISYEIFIRKTRENILTEIGRTAGTVVLRQRVMFAKTSSLLLPSVTAGSE